MTGVQTTEQYDGQVIVSGLSRGFRESRDPRGRVTGHSFQVLKRSNNGSVEVITVRLPEGLDPATCAEGKYVEMVVDVSSFESTIYYRGVKLLTKPEAKPEAPRPSVKPQGTAA